MKKAIKSERQNVFGYKVFNFFTSPFTSHPSRNVSLCFLSSLLFILSHPPYNLWPLAWIALIPLFFALENKSFWQSFRLGYIFGIGYFFGMFWWFVHVTWVGMILLNLYLALYMALFAATYHFFQKSKLGYKIFFASCAWVAWEFARARFLSGFGWACLGHTQFTQLWVIQITKLAGVFGVSFVIFFFNQVIYFFIKYWKDRKNQKRVFGLVYFAAAFVLLNVFFFGFLEIIIQLPKPIDPPLQVAVIQPNIDQKDKWNSFKYYDILDKLFSLSREAAKKQPDLIVWPESAIPSLPEQTSERLKVVQNLAQEIQIPILLGYVRFEQGLYYNSAGLISSAGEIVEQYDKLFLVPFGEFVPLRKTFPFLAKAVPIGDITPGQEKTVFRLNKKTRSYLFSVLICFEDTLDHAARLFINNGAHIFVNITNDAWFQKTKAPWLHLQSAVFQAVGYERFLVRAANTGVSAVISPTGKISGILQSDDGQSIFRSGISIFEVYPQQRQTFLARFGDIFAYICIACLGLGVIINKKIKILNNTV